jgi:hypothetical protein
MAKEIDTGMDKQEMKRLLMKSKSEPVNCAFGSSDTEKNVALLMLDKVKAPRAVEKEITKKFPKAFNTRFGTAFVDTEIDAKLARFTINKPISGAARKLVKTLKGTGFTKVEIVLEDGTVVDSVAEEEDEDAEAEGQEAEGSAGTIPVAPPLQPPPQQPEPKLDPAELTRLLTEQVKRIPGVLGFAPTLKDQLAKFATDAQVNIKTNNLTYAKTAIEQLRRALDTAEANKPQGAPTAPPPPPQPQAQTAPRQDGAKVAYAKSRLAWLAVRKKVEGDLDKLRSEIVATFSENGEAATLDKLFRDKVAPVMATLDESLADKLDEATNAADPAQRQKLIAEAKAIIQSYTTYVNSEPLLGDFDDNPFAPLAIRATLTTTLSTLDKTIV